MTLTSVESIAERLMSETKVLSDVMQDAKDAEIERLTKQLADAELAMDTAAMHGVGEILGPAYRDSWAATHSAICETLKRVTICETLTKSS